MTSFGEPQRELVLLIALNVASCVTVMFTLDGSSVRLPLVAFRAAVVLGASTRFSRAAVVQ
jgi:hypothetical protein